MPVIGSQYYLLSESDRESLEFIGQWDTVAQYFSGPVGGYYYATPGSFDYDLFDLFEEAGIGFEMGNYIFSNQWQIGV